MFYLLIKDLIFMISYFNTHTHVNFFFNFNYNVDLINCNSKLKKNKKLNCDDLMMGGNKVYLKLPKLLHLRL